LLLPDAPLDVLHDAFIDSKRTLDMLLHKSAWRDVDTLAAEVVLRAFAQMRRKDARFSFLASTAPVLNKDKTAEKPSKDAFNTVAYDKDGDSIMKDAAVLDAAASAQTRTKKAAPSTATKTTSKRKREKQKFGDTGDDSEEYDPEVQAMLNARKRRRDAQAS
jgi:hypothetical protein